MKKILLNLCFLFFAFNISAQQVNSYSINVEFFPEDAQMWNYSVANDAFMRGNSKVNFSQINSNNIVFYLHGELKIDSIISGNTSIKYNSEKIFYKMNYSSVALKTTISSSAIALDETLNIYYSGFMNPSRARSLSNYMHINKNEGVFL